MSKPVSEKKAEAQAAGQVRVDSLIRLKADFDNNTLTDNEKYFDRRTYYDGTDEYYPWMFSKTLEHDPITGFPKKNDVEKLVDGWKYGDAAHLDAIPISSTSTRKLEGVSASQSFNLMGTDSSVIVPKGFHTIDSVGGAFEMAEVYAMSLARDVPFVDFDSHQTIGAIVSSLNSFTDKTSAPLVGGAVTRDTVFRGSSVGEAVGPYISQFLMHTFNYGNLEVVQKFTSELDHVESTDFAEFVSVQNGKVNGSIRPVIDAEGNVARKYCYSPRVLGAKVHSDPLYQFYYNAALICLGKGIAGPSGFSHARTSDWTSGGAPNVLACVAHVCQGALRMAWHSKFGIAMKIRPEVMAARIQLAQVQPDLLNKVPGLNSLKNNIAVGQVILDLISADQSNLLLKNQFPEGSPTHPSYPAGHATVAGAAVTVLKAMLNCHDANNVAKPWTEQVLISNTGDDLTEVPVVPGMTVISELNKLASNVALGRDWAGVHYRCDGDCGVIAGEDFAITYLQDVAKEYHESKSGLFTGFLLEKFNGDKVIITANGVENV